MKDEFIKEEEFNRILKRHIKNCKDCNFTIGKMTIKIALCILTEVSKDGSKRR